MTDIKPARAAASSRRQTETAAKTQANTAANNAQLPFSALDNPDDMPFEGRFDSDHPVEFEQVPPDDHD
jgi:hypothetical protein